MPVENTTKTRLDSEHGKVKAKWVIKVSYRETDGFSIGNQRFLGWKLIASKRVCQNTLKVCQNTHEKVNCYIVA